MGALISGCQTPPEIVMISPKCTPYPEPFLERVHVEELKLVEDETYEKLRKNELKLLNWGQTNEKILNEICDVGVE